MAAEAPTNNCLVDIASGNATTTAATISNLLLTTLPFGGSGDSCTTSSSPTSTAAFVVERFYQAYESINLSFNVPDHPELNLFGHSTIIKSNAMSGRYAIELPDIQSLIDVQLAAFISTFFGVLFATIIYRTMLFNKNSNHDGKPAPIRRRKAIMIGSTLILACIILPYILITLSGVQNTAVRFVYLSLFVLNMFRTLEAMFGFVPQGAKSSWGTYCAYFSLPFDMMFDEQTSMPIMATKKDMLLGQINVIKCVSCIVMLCSTLSPYDYVPFGETNAGEYHEKIVLRDYLDLRHLGNCFVIALLFQQALALGDAVIGNSIQFTLGYKAKQIMRNPMLEATSPSDFWGRRWNVLVHSVMKRGVYKPVRKYTSSAVMASLAVFFASGIFHEWFVHAVLMYDRPSELTSGVVLGSNCSFFLWNFVVIVSEKVLAGSKVIRSFGKMIPNMCIPFMIIMTSLPMAHWFGNPYLKGNYFADYEKCLPLIRKV